MTQSKDPLQFAEFTPIEFLDNMEDDKHIIMFDENHKYSKKIQFHFLRNGLEKGEFGIYAMPEDQDTIEKNMEEHGIDVEKYKKENLLNIHNTTHMSQHSHRDPFDNLSRKIMPSDPANPCRIVGMLNFDMNTQEGLEAFLKSEKKSHSSFECFNGSWMCTYPTANIESKNRLNWVKGLTKNHNAVIFTSSKGEGIAFDIKHH